MCFVCESVLLGNFGYMMNLLFIVVEQCKHGSLL